MAVYKLFPVNDASIYSEFPLLNTGLDAMNEVRNVQSTEPGTTKNIRVFSVWNTEGATWSSNPLVWSVSDYVDYTNSSVVSRFLIKFEQNDIDYVLDNIVKDKNYDAHLISYIATAEGVAQEATLEVFPVAKSWINGTGMYADSPQVQDGVSWTKRNNNTNRSGFWETSSADFAQYVTASFYPSEPGGGEWYTGSTDPNLTLPSTQTFDIRTKKDLDVKVTDIVTTWYSQSKGVNPYTAIENNGLIVKWQDSLEWGYSILSQPDMKFYSSDTYTIYPPALEIRWDDYDYQTGSLEVIPTSQLYMSLDENPGEFYEDSINRFRINCRPKYPVRTYQTGSVYTDNFVLPSSSYYAIKDLDTNEYVVDFDKTYTRISADNRSSYFYVYMNGLEPERYYQVLIQTEVDNEVLVYKDRNFQFKVKNG